MKSYERNPLAAASPMARQREDELMADLENRRAQARREDMLRDGLRDVPLTSSETGQPVTPVERARGAMESDPLAASTPHADAAMQRKMRDSYEQSFPRGWRWLRSRLRIPQQLYSFASSMSDRLNGLYRDQAAQGRAIQELTQLANGLATELNSSRRERADLLRRLEYYERTVPPLRRAKEDFDRLEAERLLADQARDRAQRPPVIPFDRNGVSAVTADAPPPTQP